MVRVEVRLADGTVLEETVEAPRGSELSFASEADVVAKFRKLAGRTLAPSQVERVVEMLEIDGLVDTLEQRICRGALYGDFQFAIDPTSPQFMRTGILSCYHPTGECRNVPPRQRRLAQSDWNRLLELAHRDKGRAFEEFAAFYLSTSGQLYWSDTHQLNLYLENYHGALDERLGASMHGGEMITELYVPRSCLAVFMEEIRRDFLERSVDLIYGTIRLIEGVTRTETMVVLSTHTERTQIVVAPEETGEPGNGRRHRHGAVKNGLGESKRT